MTALGHLLTAVALGTADFFFPLLTLRDELHLLAVGLCDALSNDNLVETAKQLFDALAITAFDFHALSHPLPDMMQK
jgi:hypothetical protein